MSKLPPASVPTRKASSKVADDTAVVDLERYVPAFFTWIANKLSGGASTSVLNDKERETLIGLLRRLHDNLPAVEKATQDYLSRHYPKAKLRRARGSDA